MDRTISRVYVLIETLWNVKGIMNLAAASGEDRINRNIVECKGRICDEFLFVFCSINRNIVECKDEHQRINTAMSYGINRNIVECKAFTFIRFSSCHIRINRNIVECKGGKSTWKKEGRTVLIETLWNVKGIPAEYGYLLSGINRNIVECKVVRFMPMPTLLQY